MAIEQINILAVGRNAAVMTVLERLLNAKENRYGKTVLTDAEAVAEVQARDYHIVLLCGGLLPEEEAQLRAQLLAIDYTLIIAQHYGGGSGLLENEILHALAGRLDDR